MITLSVVVPVYNSEQSLPELISTLADVLPALAESFEVVMVNDGSRDGSWAAIQRLAQQYAWVRGYDLMRNYGQHNALLCGIRHANGDLIATIDDDLQHPPAELHRLLDKLNEGYDVVYGTPQKQQHGFLRDMASEMTKIALQSSMGVDVARNVSAFRVFRTPLRAAFVDYRGSFINIDVLLTWATTRFAAIPVRHDERKFGASNYTFRKLLTHALNMITGFSVLPLQLASLIGFLLTLFGVVVFVYVVGRYLLEGGIVPGFPFLAAIIAIFSGAQLFALGIMGEYMARMHFRLMDRPSYLVRSEATEPSE